MKAVFLLLLLALPLLAYADLYRWIDPQSGSVKLSNTPPPWYESGSGPQVERLPYSGPAAARATPQESAAAPVAALQARWREALNAASSQPSKERLEILVALTADLERTDPAGAPRRREEVAAVLRKILPR
jgi:hypothetical protein